MTIPFSYYTPNKTGYRLMTFIEIFSTDFLCEVRQDVINEIDRGIGSENLLLELAYINAEIARRGAMGSAHEFAKLMPPY